MQLFGNLLTHYRYEHSRWDVHRADDAYEVRVTTAGGRADLHVIAGLAVPPMAPPSGSPFPNFTEARKFAGPLPFTFDYESQTDSIIRVQGVREQWNPRPVSVTVHRNAFLEQDAFRGSGAVLANAFYLENVPYSWRRGIRERVAGMPVA
jgi:hypothetical protein